MPSIDAQPLATAIATATPETLASLLALLEETSISSVIWGKYRDFADKKESGSSFSRALSERAESLSRQPAPELMLILYGVLNNIAEIRPRIFGAPKDFEDNCEELATVAITLMKKYDPTFVGTSLNDLVRHQSRAMFSEIENRFAELSSEKQHEFMDKIRSYVHELPEEQRRKLHQELKADELSDEYLRKVITTGALGSAFAATVGISGFSFYMGASSLLAGMAGLIGLTLPFGIYTALSSAIAVLANPLFLLAFVGGGGIWLYKDRNRQMRERLLPLVITNLVVASLCVEEKREDSSRHAIELWSAAWQKVQECRSTLQQKQAELADAKSVWKSTCTELEQSKKDKKQLLVERLVIINRLTKQAPQMVQSIQNGEWGDGLVSLGGELKSCLDKLLEAQNRPKRESLWGKIADSAGKFLDQVSIKVTIEKLSKNIAEQAVLSWEQGVHPGLSGEAPKLVELHQLTQALNQIICQTEKVAQSQKEVCDHFQQQVVAAAMEKMKAESAWPGMEQIP